VKLFVAFMGAFFAATVGFYTAFLVGEWFDCNIEQKERLL
jgi:membrane protein DedA with SNARE-associated domain